MNEFEMTKEEFEEMERAEAREHDDKLEELKTAGKRNLSKVMRIQYDIEDIVTDQQVTIMELRQENEELKKKYLKAVELIRAKGLETK